MLTTIAPVAPIEPRPAPPPPASPRPVASRSFASTFQQTQQAQAQQAQQTQQVLRTDIANAGARMAVAPGAATQAEQARRRAAASEGHERQTDQENTAAPTRTPAADSGAFCAETQERAREDGDRDDAKNVGLGTGCNAPHCPPVIALEVGGSPRSVRAAAAASGDKGSSSGLSGVAGSPGGAVPAPRPDPAQAGARDARGTHDVVAAATEPQSLKPHEMPAVASGKEERLPPTRIEGRTDAPMLAGPASPSAQPAPLASPPLDVGLPIRVDAPEFAQALAVQVSVLVQDGVQRAELHLNPAETGPVSVLITVDGSQARVDFGADDAATRRAIEAGLPELASALRDAGMTLQGGGVSQHARQHSGESDPSGSPARGSPFMPRSSEAAQAVAIARRTVAAGGVDLYA